MGSMLDLVLGSIFIDLGVPLGKFLEAKIAPRRPKMAPRRAQRWPKMAPERFEDALRGIQVRFRSENREISKKL